MGRYHTLLITLILSTIVYTMSPAVAVADSACPDSTASLGVLHGTYTSDIETCVAYANYAYSYAFSSSTSGGYPCDQKLTVNYSHWIQSLAVIGPLFQETADNLGGFYGVPEDRELGGIARVRAYIMFRDRYSSISPPNRINGEYIIEYINSGKQRIDTVTGELDDLIVLPQEYTSPYGFTRYRNVYYLDELVNVTYGAGTATGGFFKISLRKTTGFPWDIDTVVSSVQIANVDSSFPAMCPASGSFIGPTATPSPTPTGTLFTPEFTAVPATLQPTATLTPLSFSTIPPAPTFTPLAIPTLAPLVYPTLNVPTIPNPVVSTAVFTGTPTITPTATTTPIPTTDLSTIDAAVGSFATQISQPISQSITALTITSTANISSTSESLNTTLSYVGYPIRFIKAIRLYAPNSWEFWFVALSAVFIITFVYVAKFALALVTWAIEWIRKIWEAVPLN